MIPFADQSRIRSSFGQATGSRDARASWVATRGSLNIHRAPQESATELERKQVLVDSALLVGLSPLFLGMAIVIVGAAIFRAYNEPSEAGLFSFLIGLTIGAVFLAARHLMIHGRIPTRWAHPLAALLTTAGYVFVLYNLVVRQDGLTEMRFVGLTLLIIMTGALFLHLRWLLGMIAFIFCSWTIISQAAGLSVPPSAYLILFPIIGVSSLANFAARKQAISRMIDAQMENDLRNSQLAEALERAHQSEAQLKAERDLADQVVNSMGQGLALLDDRGVIEFANPAAVQIFGQPRSALIGRPIAEILTAESVDLRERLEAGAAGDPEESIESFIDHGDGKLSHVLASITSRESGGAILNLTDLTLRKEFEARLARLAHYDALTGLANRSLLYERIQQELLRMERRQSRIGLLFLDLDRFKPINDTAGHAVGDLVLIEIANRIQMCVRAQDTVARIGGDEFVVLLIDVDDAEMTLEIADRIVRRVREPIVVEDRAHAVLVSIGIVTNQSSGADPEDLIRLADAAMYEAKNRSDVSRILYTPDSNAQRQLA